MSIRKALRQNSVLATHVYDGAKALERKDNGCIKIQSRPKVIESLYLDEALRALFPTANRWDYIVSTNAGLFGIEAHTAKDDQYSTVVRKKRWAVDRMQEHLNIGKRVSRWFWVASGFVAFKDTGSTRRQLNQEGIEFPGKSVELP